MDFFYDRQIYRLILQVNRMFSGIYVQTGVMADGSPKLRQVPVRYGETSRMVNNIIRQNSENKILSTPFMAVYITSVNMAPERRQAPQFTRTDLVDEREFNASTGEYTQERGNRFSVIRHMAVPYNFTFQLDIWTSNIDQKMQIMEQIMMLFNPAIDFQTSDSPLDWTAITYAEMQDSITWTGKSVPVGTDDQIDVGSFQFTMPYWINPPAKLERRRAIETIKTNLQSVGDLPENDSDFSWNQGENLGDIFITPNQNGIKIQDDCIFLTSDAGALEDKNGNTYNWQTFLQMFGNYESGRTSITVKRRFGDPHGVTGKIYFTAESNKLRWEIDPETLPSETLPEIDAIIDPHDRYPGDGVLSPAVAGQRYLLVSDLDGQLMASKLTDEIVAPNTEAWGPDILASANDIIQYNGTQWTVSFDASESNSTQVVRNDYTDKKFRWNPDKQDWEPVIDGLYCPGTWKVDFSPGQDC